MATSREPTVVAVLTCAVLLFVLLSINTFSPTPTTPPVSIPGCPGPIPKATIPSTLSPQSPVLMSKCTGYPVSSGSISFSVSVPVDLRGAWAANNPLAVEILNATVATMTSYGWPPLFGVLNGSLNATLFPGEYEILFYPYGTWANTTWVATQTVQALFDRGLLVLHGSENVTLSAAGYAAWPISSPTNASSFVFEGWMATTACDYELVVAPHSVFVNFTSGSGSLLTDGTILLLGASTNTCTVSAEPNEFGPWEFGPLSLAPGAVLVFLNQAGASVSLSVVAPIEISYLLGTAS